MSDLFAERLRRIREYRGISRRALATRAGLYTANVSRFEAGIFMPKQATVERLAQALEVLPAELLGTENELPPLRPYLRAAYGMDETAAADVERYIIQRYGDDEQREPGERR